ncbi:EamA family transporter [Candidatus Fermentibacteria bacterium]|nr:EamA family transporter [Candidatus Fermentibacteria bacterium]
MAWLAVVSLVWSFSFGIIRSTLAGIDSGLVSFLRLAIASLAALPALRARRLSPDLAGRLMLLGAVQFGMMYISYIESFRWLEAWEVAMLTITTPLFVVIASGLLEGDGRRITYASAAAAVIGGGFILWGAPQSEDFLRGFILVQVSNVCFAAGQVWYRRLMAGRPALGDSGVIALPYLGGALVTALPAAASVGRLSCMTGRQWASVAYLGLVASGAGFFMWNHGAKQAGTGVLAAFNNAKIPLSVAASIVVFGERPSLWRLAAGTVLVAAGILLGRADAGWRSRRASGRTARSPSPERAGPAATQPTTPEPSELT